MNRQRIFAPLLSLTLLPFALGAVGCSNGSSPTEPAFTDDLAETTAAVSSSVSAEGEKRRGRGGDDTAGDDRRGGRGRGGDDQPGDDRGRRGRRGGNDDRPNRPQNPRNGQEFEGAVVSVAGNTLTLAGGVRVTVNAQTQWIARGDLFSLSQVAGSVQSGDPTRVEGRGVRQADGSFLALTIKAEVDN